MRGILTITLMAVALASTVPMAAQQAAVGSRKLVEKSEPTYPALARKNGLIGAVKLRVVVAPDGKAKSVDVLGGNPVFVQSASDSVKKWKWAVSDHESTENVEVRFDSGSQGY